MRARPCDLPGSGIRSAPRRCRRAARCCTRGSSSIPGRLDVEFVMTRQRLQHLKVMRVAPIPAAHRAAGERQVRMHDHALGIEELLKAEAVAGRAGAGGIVEREHARLERRHREAAFRTGVAAGEQHRRSARSVREHHPHDALARARIAVSKDSARRWRGVRPHAKAIHHRLDGVLAASDRASAPHRSRSTAPSMRTRTKPWPASSAEQLARARRLRSSIIGASSSASSPAGRLQHLIHHLAHASVPPDRCRGAGSAAARRAHTAGAGNRRSR